MVSKARELSRVASAVSYGTLSNRNLLINNDFRIWQRGDVFTGDSVNTAYTADRWSCVYSGVIDHVKRGLRLKVGANTSLNKISQIIENNNDYFQSNFDIYTASIKFNAPLGSNIEVSLEDWQVGKVLFSDSVAATGKDQIFQVSGSLKALLSGNNPSFSLKFNGVSNGDIVEVYNTQIEGGHDATPFECRPYSQELILCQRFYEDIWIHGAVMNAYQATRFSYGYQQFCVKKVSIPTVKYLPKEGVLYYGVHYNDKMDDTGTFLTNAPPRREGFSFRYQRGNNNFPAGTETVHAYCHVTADAEY